MCELRAQNLVWKATFRLVGLNNLVTNVYENVAHLLIWLYCSTLQYFHTLNYFYTNIILARIF